VRLTLLHVCAGMASGALATVSPGEALPAHDGQEAVPDRARWHVIVVLDLVFGRGRSVAPGGRARVGLALWHAPSQSVLRGRGPAPA